MELVVAFAIGLIVLCLIGKIVSLPVKLLWKMITNSIVGAVMLWIVNLFGAGIQITFIKALVAGVFGIPGVLVVVLLSL
ncbi:MAG: pro-sigmaK processing inhibitor BofA family protein [Selenomonadales bacterium]|nr:pro-sigmaK processing inhibitor BofA family protein [Selenomonadales bacterium]MDD7763114.1 pro-sigmaK processing inhibitor BofA family protein [Selenomonadales bacterium]